MSFHSRLKRLEQRQPPRGYREAIIMDDLVATDNLEEDETILGLSEIGWDDPDCKVWMRKKGELSLFDAVRSP